MILPSIYKIINIENLKKFCIENKLDVSCMYDVASGKRSIHRGWRKV